MGRAVHAYICWEPMHESMIVDVYLGVIVLDKAYNNMRRCEKIIHESAISIVIKSKIWQHYLQHYYDDDVLYLFPSLHISAPMRQCLWIQGGLYGF